MPWPMPSTRGVWLGKSRSLATAIEQKDKSFSFLLWQRPHKWWFCSFGWKVAGWGSGKERDT
jgi:hypothetical protein